MYRLERTIKDLPPGEKYQQRQQIAKPLLEDLKAWLEKNIGGTLKGGLTYKAMYYTLNQWPKLIRCCEDGRLHISNAGAENAIRPFAVGRRRWLFSDTPTALYVPRNSPSFSLYPSPVTIRTPGKWECNYPDTGGTQPVPSLARSNSLSLFAGDRPAAAALRWSAKD